MLLLDVSHIMYSGQTAVTSVFGENGEHQIRCIPYFLQKIAAFYSIDTEMIAVFEHNAKIPALATNTGYKSGRKRNPQVEWEINVLRNLLEYIKFPILEFEGQESDYIINNYCRQNKEYEDIYIVSGDMDLASNICNTGEYKTSMVGYSSKSHNITSKTFKVLTGVEYNFMNVNKLLLGCTSDRIPEFNRGKEIYYSFMSNVYATLRLKYGINHKIHDLSKVKDSLILTFGQHDYFFNWFKKCPYYSPANEQELERRWAIITGPEFFVPEIPQVDWRVYNQFIESFGISNTGLIFMEGSHGFSLQVLKAIQDIFNTTNALTAFDDRSELEKLKIEEEVADVSNLIDILGGGAL